MCWNQNWRKPEVSSLVGAKHLVTKEGQKIVFEAPTTVVNPSVIRVPGAGLEPARPLGHRILNPERLPIPPPGQFGIAELNKLAVILLSPSGVLKLKLPDTNQEAKLLGKFAGGNKKTASIKETDGRVSIKRGLDSGGIALACATTG